MKITESRYDALVARGVTLREGLTELGIKIVPDPEPELPAKPWRVVQRDNQPTTHYKGGGLYVSTEPLGPCIEDADGNRILVVMGGWAGRGETELLEHIVSAVSAYNAAGERKRIEVHDSYRRSDEWLFNEEIYRAQSRNEALGFYVRQHASDLGLEIVES